MVGGHLIREARRRARLTQAELAERLVTKQSVIARWETGSRVPSLETVLRAVRACGFDLTFSLTNRDFDHKRLIRDHLRMSPLERVADLEDRVRTEAKLRGAARVK